jgi:hypothetical protein
MSKHTHLGQVRNGTVLTVCGKSFPAANATKPWFFWGTCPDCQRIQQQRKQKGR